MSALVRLAREEDVEAINAIHNRAILETAFTWHWEPFTLAVRQRWFSDQQAADRPVFVAEVDGIVAGFSAYGPFRAFVGYRETMEHSVYVDPDTHKRGLGRALMEALLDAARARGVHVMVAAIALPNDPSIALHRALGFSPVGVMPEVGLKFDRYHDLCLMQKIL